MTSSTRARTVRLACCVLVLAASVRGQDRSGAVPFAIPGHGSLNLAVPPGWRVASEPREQPASLQLRFGPPTGDAFSLQVTAVWLESDKVAQTTPAKLKAETERAAKGPLQQAVEKAAVVQELRGAAATGYYFSLTDRAPPPEEYKYLTQGMSITGEVMLAFTLLHRQLPSPDKDQALAMLANATHSK